MNCSFVGKRVLVTGACGTVGRELVRQLLAEFGVASLVGIDHDESELVFLGGEFSRRYDAKFFLADIRDRDSMVQWAKKVDVIFHTAANKHVYLCEHSPMEAVHTNITGLQNVIHAALHNEIERMVFTSSDKAVNPTNVMGTSKLMGERLMTAAAINRGDHSTTFVSTRFGNVLGSRGSVIPIFLDQIRRGGPVTLTDPEMSRFIMSLGGAVQLVVDSAAVARNGDVMITKMPTIRIQDLAEVMIRECAALCGHRPGDIHIETIGAKPGEKLYEELMNSEETRRAIELDRYFVVRPALVSADQWHDVTYPNQVGQSPGQPYTSETEAPLTQDELSEFLRLHRLIPTKEQPADVPYRSTT